MSTLAVPHRQYDRDLVPFRVAGSLSEVQDIAVAVVKRIRRNREVYLVGSFVFADVLGVVRVVKEGPNADRLVSGEPEHLVGMYGGDSRGNRRVQLPDAELIEDDLREHFAGIGFGIPVQFELWTCCEEVEPQQDRAPPRRHRRNFGPQPEQIDLAA